MGKFIVKFTADQTNYFLVWSTIVDAPITVGMSLDDLQTYIQEEYGRQGMNELPARLERVESHGTSSVDGETPDDMILGNRAGPNEATLTKQEIIDAYCLRKPIRNGWSPIED